ncbi:MAG: Na+/H+ antiporter [Gammaproteobacteria bacterium]|jgi:Na+/H+ antiporter|nr:Na+/H+ antiporter [Gammaproteobacteria bacterium]|tara:strand:- start:2313 stop:3578 length:1266 start_codon:yes stop_codon:yes gene_type:complete
MHEETILGTISIVIGLIFAASISAIFVKKARLPYTIGLLIVGIGIGYLSSRVDMLAPLREVQLTPDIILFLILPTLLFEASINIDSRLLSRNLVPILLLATVGLLISTVIVGFGISAVTPLTLGAALVFGALISATDPVAVIALFKELGVPKRLSTLVDGESLFNDATAIVVFNILIVIITTGTAFSASVVISGVGQFLLVFIGGLLAGVTLGAAMLWIIALERSDHMVQAALTSVLAYLAFIVAEHLLEVSGVMAVVAAGILTSWAGMRVFDDSMRRYLTEFWELMAFLANSMIFLLMGLTEYHLFADLGRYNDTLGYILIGFMLTIIARFLVVYGLTPLANRLAPKARVERDDKAVIFWGGLRGAIPLALALGLPADFEHRIMIIDLTLGVVLMSLLIQGISVSWLLRKLGLIEVAVKS